MDVGVAAGVVAAPGACEGPGVGEAVEPGVEDGDVVTDGVGVMVTRVLGFLVGVGVSVISIISSGVGVGSSGFVSASTSARSSSLSQPVSSHTLSMSSGFSASI